MSDPRQIVPALAVAALAWGGCVSVHSSVFRTTEDGPSPRRGPVALRFTGEPAGASIAVVQAYGKAADPIGGLLRELSRRAAELGADTVRVDRVSTRYDEVKETKTNSYPCGTEQEPRTCTDTSTVTTEVGTTQILGRAFRTRRR